MIYKKIGNIYFTTSWDDGHPLDLRIAELLKKYTFTGTFFIAPNNPEREVMKPTVISKLSYDRLFEIGGHTNTHVELSKVSPEVAIAEIREGKRVLRRGLYRQTLDSFCYPKGRYNEDVKAMVKKCKFREARTVDVLNNKLPKDNYAIKPTIHVHPSRKEYNGKNWLEVAKEVWKDPETEYFHLWGHSWEIEKYGLWDELEELFKFIKSYED